MIHFCIDVYTRQLDGEWGLWFTQSFKTKKLAETWANGFKHGIAPVYIDEKGNLKIGKDKKLSEIYRRKRDYHPNIG